MTGRVKETLVSSVAEDAHGLRTAWLVERLAVCLGLDAAARQSVVRAALLHDIGKRQVDQAVLCKPGRLDADERRHIEMHVVFGASTLLSRSTDYRLAAQVALLHHEWWNGAGYPFGLAAEGIPLFARITAVADVFDALSEERCYKPAWPHRDVVAYVAAQRGRQFDPRCADAMQEVAAGLPADWHRQALASSISQDLELPCIPTSVQGDPMVDDRRTQCVA
jgi:putative two-component system response regulator